MIAWHVADCRDGFLPNCDARCDYGKVSSFIVFFSGPPDLGCPCRQIWSRLCQPSPNDGVSGISTIHHNDNKDPESVQGFHFAAFTVAAGRRGPRRSRMGGVGANHFRS